jgi:Fe-S-cluster-containing dehydrogenase component
VKPRTIVIEHEKCWGCKTCEVACKQEFELAAGIKLIAVEDDGPQKINGRLHFQYRVNLCRHCDDPPCADVCPDAAIHKRPDGIVVLDDVLCSGCQACLDACPYDAIDFDPTASIARKCNLCHHRVDHGLIPACADNVCLAHCIHFVEAEHPPATE